MVKAPEVRKRLSTLVGGQGARGTDEGDAGGAARARGGGGAGAGGGGAPASLRSRGSSVESRERGKHDPKKKGGGVGGRKNEGGGKGPLSNAGAVYLEECVMR